MYTGLVQLLHIIEPAISIGEYLSHSLYDEQIDIDLLHDYFRVIFHVEGKYLLPIKEGSYDSFYRYVSDHLIHPEDRERYMEHMEPEKLAERMTSPDSPGIFEVQFRCDNGYGGWRWVSQLVTSGERCGVPESIIRCFVYDIQSVRDREAGYSRVQEKNILEMDHLTGLYRNKDFYRKAESLLVSGSRKWLMIAIDLENFTLFNDWYGRDAGDMVLARIGAGLKNDAARCKGCAGYMGNDDFALLVPEGSIDLDELYDKIHCVIRRYGMSTGFLPALGFSCCEEELSVMELFDQAELAVHQAKKNYKVRICKFDPSMRVQAEKEYQLLSDFQNALKTKEIFFCVQPQCRASTGKIAGVESLARWQKADGTFITPDKFIPVLEKYGFITDLDKYIWEAVAKWIRERLDLGKTLVPVSVNVSQVDIFTIDVPAFFISLTEEYRLPRNAIKIEITESACGEDSAKVRETVERLREDGFYVLMDDFGSGYSSLNMLNELTVDVIKLDARFLHLDGSNDEKGIRIIESVVGMTKNMGIPIIVEGVETKAQKEFLMQLGCRFIQGYCFYKPMKPEIFDDLTSGGDMIDPEGITFKPNEQFQVREFFNGAIYSDTMLNEILGPAAFYEYDGREVNIVRFNEQFYEAVCIPDFMSRLDHIEQYMPAADAAKLHELLQEAVKDRMNGSEGEMTFCIADGGALRFRIRFYLLDSKGKQKLFFGSARNITTCFELGQRLALLSETACTCIIFLKMYGGKICYEVAAQGLGKEMGLSRTELETELNDGIFFKRLKAAEGVSCRTLCEKAFTDRESFRTEVVLELPEEGELALCMRGTPMADTEPLSNIRAVVVLSKPAYSLNET